MSQAPRESVVPVAEDRERVSAIATAKSLFFLAAGISLIASVAFYFTGDPQRGIFVGIWVPSILSAGALLMVGHDHG